MSQPSRLILLTKSQSGRCYYCRDMMTRSHQSPRGRTIDHKIPRARDGTNDLANLVAACRRCNELKDQLTEAEFRAAFDMANLPEWRPGGRVPAGIQMPSHGHRMRTQVDFVGHDHVSQAVRHRAGYDPATMGLKDAATATIGEIVAAKLSNSDKG